MNSFIGFSTNTQNIFVQQETKNSANKRIKNHFFHRERALWTRNSVYFAKGADSYRLSDPVGCKEFEELDFCRYFH